MERNCRSETEQGSLLTASRQQGGKGRDCLRQQDAHTGGSATPLLPEQMLKASYRSGSSFFPTERNVQPAFLNRGAPRGTKLQGRGAGSEWGALCRFAAMKRAESPRFLQEPGEGGLGNWRSDIRGVVVL